MRILVAVLSYFQHKDEANKPEAPPKEKSPKQKQIANKSENDNSETKLSKKIVKQQTSEVIPQNTVEKEQAAEEPVIEQVIAVPLTNGFVSGANSNGSKEKKKKKNEQNTIQQLSKFTCIIK